MAKIRLDEIPHSGHYEGYLWLSDQHSPIVLRGEGLGCVTSYLKQEINPFIIEGYIYDASSGYSYSLRHLDGELQVWAFNLAEMKEMEEEEVTYLPHRITGIKKLRFSRFWVAETDEMCEGMEVLKFKYQVFKGFIY
ncbi:hypothetical protein IX339_000085 [Porphyromonas levii]|uniref:TIGR04423 family type III CRISPR-associated protein n=1 Tax=Porphyromonas levii TaxID=28114 RepID=UPI001B8BCCBF|nr:TIGR04423 family type III CRISPR-associated protein [Porphyromonas levii]MBR8730655.1 hypothetical protein [Porphyromonas levii]